MLVERINTYNDPRFSPEARVQHGCYLVGGAPCEVRIISGRELQALFDSDPKMMLQTCGY